MPISFRCSRCQAKISAKDTAAGKSLNCPKCTAAVTVPSIGSSFSPVNVDLLPIDDPEPRRIPARPFVEQPKQGEIVHRPQSDPLAFSDDEEENGHIVVHGARTHIHVQQRRQHSHSLGIAGMVLGIVGIALFCIPFVGLALGGLACLLAIVGLIASGTRRGTGIGFGIAGVALGLISAALGGFATYSFYAVGRAFHEAGTKLTKTWEEELAKEKADKEKQFSDEGRADASKESIVRGDVKIKVASAVVGKVPVRSLGHSTQSEKDLLQIKIEISNGSEAKKLDYLGWGAHEFSILNDASASLRDSAGNEYRTVHFGFGREVEGQVRASESIYPREKVSDLLIFEIPVEQADWLFLDLPAKNIGGTGVVRFKIPKSMVKR